MTQQWNANLYDDKHAFVWKQAASLLELLAPQRGERILDLGCGTGHLTALIAAAGAEVVGFDAAPTMIEQARRTFPQLRFEIADARDFDLGNSFDAVFSNAVLHWIKEPQKVIACVHRSLKPGGRFVAEFGGKGNIKAIVAALETKRKRMGSWPFEMPWYFPGIGEYSALLEQDGLEVTYAVLFDRPTPLDGEDGMRNWIRMFANHLLVQVAEDAQEEFLRQVEEELRPQLCRDGSWYADYRRLRVVARRVD